MRVCVLFWMHLPRCCLKDINNTFRLFVIKPDWNVKVGRNRWVKASTWIVNAVFVVNAAVVGRHFAAESDWWKCTLLARVDARNHSSEMSKVHHLSLSTAQVPSARHRQPPAPQTPQRLTIAIRDACFACLLTYFIVDRIADRYSRQTRSQAVARIADRTASQ